MEGIFLFLVIMGLSLDAENEFISLSSDKTCVVWSVIRVNDKPGTGITHEVNWSTGTNAEQVVHRRNEYRWWFMAFLGFLLPKLSSALLLFPIALCALGY